MKRRLVLLNLCALMLVGGCATDQGRQTTPTAYEPIIGKTYSLRREMLVYGNPGDREVSLFETEYSDEGYMPLAILGLGMRIQVVDMDDSSEGTMVFVKILDGPLSGKRAAVMAPDLFWDPCLNFLPARTPANKWEANPDYLAPAQADSTRAE